MKKFIFATVVLIALVLLFSNPAPYGRAIDFGVDFFGRMWRALLGGK